jgi:serine/threonine protein kinase
LSASTRIGSEVAGYRLEQVLGRGGMSVVYLAEHLRLGRKVALKLLAPALSEDEDYRERFVRESRRAAELDHPNIIPIYDAGDDDGQLYIAMRYVEGCDLKELIRRGALPLGRALFIVEQVASALDAAHERNLIHRDVKPSNILVSEPSDRVYLTDFGVVKHTLSRGLTKTGLFIGTVDYAAPEQIEGLPLDQRVDIYALGCVFYECLAARAPFDREGEIAVMHAHLSESPPILTAVRPDLPKGLNRVVTTAMAKSRDDRFSSCEELVLAARNAALHRHTAAPVHEQDPAPPAYALAAAEGAVRESVDAGSRSADFTSDEAATPPPSPPPVAAEPAPATPAPRGRRLSPWLLSAALATVAAVAAGVAVYYATRSNSPSTQQSTTTIVSAGAGQGQTPGRGLASLMPTTLSRNSCTITSAPLVAGAVQSTVCTPPAKAADRKLPFYPDRWEVSIFPNGAKLAAAYDALRRQNDIGEDFGACNGVAWGGEGPWEHGPGKPGGRRFCYFEGNVAVIVWSHRKLGQASHIDMLGVARESGSDHPSLFSWWRFWHHRIGKCPQEGCTAQLP